MTPTVPVALTYNPNLNPPPEGTSLIPVQVVDANGIVGPWGTTTVSSLQPISGQGVFNVMDPTYAGGAKGDDTHDDTAAIVAALSAALTAGGGDVLFPAGAFLFTSFTIPGNGVHLRMYGKDITTLHCKTAGGGIFGPVGGLDGLQITGGFTYDLRGASGAVDGFDFVHGLDHAHIADIRWKIDTNSRHGLRVRGSPDGVTANGLQFDNTFARFDVATTGPATGACIYLNGYDIADARCNGNTIADCDFNHWTTDVQVNGAGNFLSGNTFGNATNGILYEGNQTTVNAQAGNYFDNSNTNNINIQVAAGAGPVFQDSGSVGLDNGAGIIDANPNASGLPRYTLWNGLQAIAAQVAFRPNLNNDTTAWSVGLQTPAGTSSDSHLFIVRAGSNSARSGKVILSGKDFAGSVNSVGNHGSVAAVIDANASDSSFRVAKTTDGSSHTQLFDMNSAGHLSGFIDSANGSLGQMTMAAATSTDVANTSVTANTRILLTARNASAGNLQKDHGVNVSVTASTKFTVIVSDGTSAAGTELFDWFLVN